MPTISKCLTVLFFLGCSIFSYSQEQHQAELTPAGGGVFPLIDAKYLRDGYRSVTTIIERDAIPADRRKYGMLVYVGNADTIYQLKSVLLDNSNWVAWKTLGGIVYSNGYGLNLTSNTFSVDSNLLTTRAWHQKGIDSLVNVSVKYNDTLSMLQNYVLGRNNLTTIGSVPFVNSSGMLQQNNSNLFWDDVSKKLGIGTNNPTEQLELTGNIKMPLTTAFAGSIKQGANTLIHSAGTNNFFAGINAGNLTTVGTNQVAIGYNALNSSSSNTDYSVAVGAGTLQYATDGINTAIGDAVLSNAAFKGSYNTGIGAGAMKNVIGANATYNVVVGTNAGQNLDGTIYLNGSWNVFMGDWAGRYVTTGTKNTFIGHASGTGANSTGSSNTFIGDASGTTNISGSNNVLLGASANVSSNNLANAIAIGANSVVSASNSLILGGTGANAVNVGIGTTSPSYQFHVVGGSNYTQASFDRNGDNLVQISSTNGNRSGIVFSSSGNQTYSIVNEGTGASRALWFINSSNINSGPVAMAISGVNNYVGIGSTAPSSPLTIANSKSTSIPVIRLDTLLSGASTDSLILWRSTDSSVRKVTASSFINGTAWGLTGNSGTNIGTNFIGTTDNHPLVFKTNNTAKFFIDSTSSNVGIGTVAPTKLLDVHGTSIALTGSQSTGIFSIGSGGGAAEVNVGYGQTAGYSSVAFGHGNNLANANASQAVALGMGNSIGGDNGIAVGDFNTGGNGSVLMGWSNTAVASASAIGKNINNSTANSLQIGPSNTAKITILSSGNVGIGNTNPVYPLTVTDGITTPTTVSTGTPLLVLEANGSSQFTVRDNLNSIESFYGTSVSGYGIGGTLSNHDFRFRTNNNDRFTIKAGGNVGIGTISPTYNLDVAGKGRFTDSLFAGTITKSGGTSAQYLMADGSVSTLTNPITGTGSLVANYLTRATGTGSIDTAGLYWGSGKLGIGTTVPTSVLALGVSASAGSSQNIDFSTANSNNVYARINGYNENINGSGHLAFYTNQAGTISEQMRIDSIGRVGIGNAAPDSKLLISTNTNILPSATFIQTPPGQGTDHFTDVEHSTGGDYSGNVSSITTGGDTRGAFHAALYGTANNSNMYALIGIRRPGSYYNTGVLSTVSNGSYLPGIAFAGQAGSSAGIGTLIGASILGQVDNTVTSATLPTSIVFNTSLTNATGLSERMRISSGGNVGVNNSTPNSTLSVNGSLSTAVATKVASYNITAADHKIFANASAGDMVITLPSAIGAGGREYYIKRIDGSGNLLTLASAGGTIDGANSILINTQYDFVEVTSDNTNWYIIGGKTVQSFGGTTLFVSNDSYVNQVAPTINYGTALSLKTIGTSGSASNSLILFDVSAIPPSSVIHKAVLNVWANTINTSGTLNYYLITSAWSESTVNWNTAPTIGSLIGTAATGTTAPSLIQLDITSTVQGWINGTIANYGIEIQGVGSTSVLLRSKESTSGGGNMAYITIF